MMKRGILLALLMACVLSTSLVAQPEVKDANPPAGDTIGTPAEATGGPDAYGYTFADSAEPNCPYQFVDISATGTSVVVGDDTSSGPLALAEPFTLYGTTYTDMVMASNGYLTTDPADTGPDLSNDCPLPATPSTPAGTMGARIYPLHDDLDLEAAIGEGFVEYFADCPRPSDRCGEGEGCTIFQWNDVSHFPGGGAAATWDTEVILYHTTGDIVAQTGAGNPETGSGSTTGIQNGGATIGLTYACNTAGSIPDDTGVCFINPDPIPDACFPIDTVAIPTANNWGLMALFLGLAIAAFFLMRRRFV